MKFKPQTRRMQERAAVGCYFFPEAENITTVP
ncbi:nucleocapsid protein [Escherichia coli O145:H25 str. 07-3858]|nr:nucleocapsid protein [Escherichia coli O145:H25 str. 07-3858]